MGGILVADVCLRSSASSAVDESAKKAIEVCLSLKKSQIYHFATQIAYAKVYQVSLIFPQHLGTGRSPNKPAQGPSEALDGAIRHFLSFSRHCRTRAGGHMHEETSTRRWNWLMSL